MADQFRAPPLPVDGRYTGRVVVPSQWRTSTPDGAEDSRNTIRIVAEHCDGGWVFEWLARAGERFSPGSGKMGHATEDNLRRVFRPVGWRGEGEDGS